MHRLLPVLLCALGSLLATGGPSAAGVAGEGVAAEGVAAEGVAAEVAQAAGGDRPQRAARGMPLPPDWPRAGGFGPDGGVGLAIEAIVAGGEFGGRALTDEDVARAVAVAHAVSPEWGTAIEARAKADPAQMRAALRSGARRLLALAALRERAPEVYEAKVVELRAQAETVRVAGELRAVELDPAATRDDRRRARAELDASAARQVEATLAVREAELAALDTVLERMRAELEVDRSRAAELAADVAARARPRRGGAAEGDPAGGDPAGGGRSEPADPDGSAGGDARSEP